MTISVLPARRTREFTEFALHLHRLDSVDDVATAIAGEGSRILADGAVSILLNHRHHLVPQVASHPTLRAADRVQLELEQGPAIGLTAGCDAVHCPDLAASDQWPLWSPVAVAHGWRSWVTLPMQSRKQHLLGVLSFAHPRPHAITPELGCYLRDFSVHAAIALDTAGTRYNLQRAIEAQTHVGRAVGVLMERFTLDADQAFAVLRRYSQDRNRKLRDVASEVVHTRRLPR
ncbi:GAF and ANTAR domain-containing protein [Kribbella sp. CA-253562]|uniref:GAF and ANTAR domain-containing protein n=1 Tax=Kribbella sp. CA-253562 TaxID=3239942 RepID=UPI003D946875